jgi:exosortase
MESVSVETELKAKHLIGGSLALICVILLCYAGILFKMAQQWAFDPNYSHGFLIPILSGYFVWRNKNAFNLSDIRPTIKGLALLVFGLLLLVIGKAGSEFFVMRVSFIVVLFGLLLFIMGTEITKKFLFPTGFLIFMIPLPYVFYNDISLPLKLLTVSFSTKFLSLIGIPFIREGNIIHLAQTSLHVIDACSGLRSIISLLAFAVLFAHLTQNITWRKFFLAFMAIPIAVISNFFRITATAVTVHFHGPKLAEGILHNLSGVVSFAVAFILLFVCSVILKKNSPSKHEKALY